MSDDINYDGEVTIPLRIFMELESRSRELETVKNQLKEERDKTWKLFGNFFEQKRVLHIEEDIYTLNRMYIIEVKQPTTKLVVDTYNLDSKWDISMICRKLVEDHILDVIKAVDVSRLNGRKYP